MKIYTDGSYDKKNSPKTTAFAAIIVKEETSEEYIVDIMFGVKDDSWVEMWNVGGELCAVISAINYAREKYNPNSIELYFDYIGIEKWVTEAWKAKKPNTIAYKDHMQKLKEILDISKI